MVVVVVVVVEEEDSCLCLAIMDVLKVLCSTVRRPDGVSNLFAGPVHPSPASKICAQTALAYGDYSEECDETSRSGVIDHRGCVVCRPHSMSNCPCFHDVS